MKPFLILLLLLQTLISFSQVRVRGYTRKDGTYVRPHTRSYPGGSSSSSSDANYSSSDDDRSLPVTIDGIETTVLDKNFKNGQYRVNSNLTLYKPTSRYSSDKLISVYEASADLTPSEAVNPKKRMFRTPVGKAEISAMVYDTNGAPVYLSVLRVNGKVGDIAAFSRSISNEREIDFSNTIYHVLDKSLLTAEQALELIDKYSFKSEEGVLKTSINLAYGRIKLPPYITHKVEVMRLK